MGHRAFLRAGSIIKFPQISALMASARKPVGRRGTPTAMRPARKELYSRRAHAQPSEGAICKNRISLPAESASGLSHHPAAVQPAAQPAVPKRQRQQVVTLLL
eukprot:6605118-Prymnesium_polylepis.1